MPGFTFVNSTGKSSPVGTVTQLVVPLTWQPAIGDFLVMGIANYNPGTETVTDTYNNAWHQDLAFSGYSGTVAIFSTRILQTGPGFNVTYKSAIASYPAGGVSEYAVPANYTVNFWNKAISSTAAQSSATTAPVPVSGTCLVFSAQTIPTAGTYHPGPGNTIRYWASYAVGLAMGIITQDILNVTGPDIAYSTFGQIGNAVGAVSYQLVSTGLPAVTDYTAMIGDHYPANYRF